LRRERRPLDLAGGVARVRWPRRGLRPRSRGSRPDRAARARRRPSASDSNREILRRPVAPAVRSQVKYAVVALALLACKGKHDAHDGRDDAAIAKDAGSAKDAGVDEWHALERFTKISPVHVVAL